MPHINRTGQRADSFTVRRPTESDPPRGVYPDDLRVITARDNRKSREGPIFFEIHRARCELCGSQNVRHNERSEQECQECGHVGIDSGGMMVRDKAAAQRVGTEDTQ